MEKPAVYCQNCRSQNRLSDTHCTHCGTRLLLVVFPQSLQYDTNLTPSFYEDHLLERVSLLELRFSQMTEAMKIAMEIIREQGRIVKDNHSQIKQLKKKLGGQKQERGAHKTPNSGEEKPHFLESIIAEHDSPNVGLFSKLVAEGVRLLRNAEEKEAFRMLERAALLSPRNVSLLVFTALQYLLADKFNDARKRLEKAFELAPDNINVLLLLGTICAEDGETDKARLYLSIPAENERTALSANLIWGMLAASEGHWKESLAAFKVAADLNKSAEIEYLIGCTYFELKDNPAALNHFQRAISADRKFADAWFMQAVVYRRLKDAEREEYMLQNAAEVVESSSQCSEFLRKRQTVLETALPFVHLKKNNERLLSAGARRLMRFIKNEIGSVCGHSQ